MDEKRAIKCLKCRADTVGAPENYKLHVESELSGNPGSIHSITPKIGEHNQELFNGLLGMTQDEFRSLAKDSII
jgi:hypothetical protein